MIFSNGVSSQVFGPADIKLESALKNPNQFREAVLFESLNNLPAAKKKEFLTSPEAKAMLEEGLVTRDMLERLAAESDNGILKTTVCHMAKENGDPAWDELVKLRLQERRLMNELLEKYGAQAHTVADNAYENFVAPNLPKYFDQNAE